MSSCCFFQITCCASVLAVLVEQDLVNFLNLHRDCAVMCTLGTECFAQLSKVWNVTHQLGVIFDAKAVNKPDRRHASICLLWLLHSSYLTHVGQGSFAYSV